MFDWTMKPQFYGIRATAANISSPVQGNYTLDMFAEDFPQFYNAEGTPLAPETLMQEILDMTNTSILPAKWGSSWRYAAGLYMAHYLTLMLRTYSTDNTTPQQAAASGALVGVVQSATLGDASVTYDTSAITAGTADWGDLNATTYGQILASRARMIGLTGSYVI